MTDRRCRRRGPAVVAIAAVLLLVGAGTGFAQDSESRVFLERQARVGEGVPVLPGDSSPYTSAVYDVDGVLVEVFVVSRTGPPEDGGTTQQWNSFTCGPNDGGLLLRYRVNPGRPEFGSSRDGTADIVWTELTPDYAAYFAGTLGSDTWCSFLSVLRSQFSFFLDALGTAGGVPLPAVLPGVRVSPPSG